MKQVLIEFEYDEKKLGRGWLNIGNLELLLYSKQYTLRELLKVRVIKKKRGINYD